MRRNNPLTLITDTRIDYDIPNGLITVTDPNGHRLRQHYDAVNRLSQFEMPDAPGAPAYAYTYDATDQLKTITYYNGGTPTGQTQGFDYDDFDRLIAINDHGIPNLIRYDYDHQGRLKDRTTSTGIQSYWHYDALTGQLKELGHKKPDGSLIYSDTFSYLPNTPLYQSITRATASGTQTTTYGYDDYQRLTTVTEPGGRKTTYTYDAFGNRLTETILNLNDPNATGGSPKAYGTYRYTYSGNRLQAIHYTAPGQTEQTLESYTYDNAGRLKTRQNSSGTTTYDWDDRGYLLKVTTPSQTISYTYDALGARKSKTVNGLTTYYVTAPLFGMSHVLMELDANQAIQTTYIYGGHEQLIEEPNASNRNNDRYLLHGGSVGSITHAITRGGIIENQFDYDVFGIPTPITASGAPTRYGYTGEEYDSEIKLLYLRARYYDPSLGRFISADPYLGRLEEPSTQNRYVYVQNNPMMYTDPSGLSTLDATWAYVGGGGGTSSLRLDTNTWRLYYVQGLGAGYDKGPSISWSPSDYNGHAQWVVNGTARIGPATLGVQIPIMDTTEYNQSGNVMSSSSSFSIGKPLYKFGGGTRFGGSLVYEQPFMILDVGAAYDKVSNWVSEFNLKMDRSIREFAYREFDGWLPGCGSR